MTAVFRAISVAAATAVLSVGAAAEVVDFESLLGSLTQSPTNPLIYPPDVGSSIAGFKFTDASAYGPDQLTGGFSTPTEPTGTHGGSVYVLSRKKNSAAAATRVTSIFVELAGTNVGKDIESLSFNGAIIAGSLQAYARDGSGEYAVGFSLAADGSFFWGPQNLDFSQLGVVDRIEFRSTGNVLFALDNLSFTYSSTGGGGGTVPEPQGYGLLGLALAAAGLATRRRRVQA